MICPKCNHSWDYKGKSTYYLTCPHCYNKIRAPRPSTQQEQIPTTQQEPTTQTGPDIEALKRKVAEYEENLFKERVDAALSTGDVCFTPRTRQFSCLQCNATIVSYPFSEICSVCGSKALRVQSAEEINKSLHEINCRYVDALEKRKAEIKEEKKAAREAAKKAKKGAAKKQSGSE